jgi:hypothetical protein
MADLTKKIEPNCTVIFSHIPKTAGTTLTSIIERQYDPSVIYKTEPDSFQKSLDLFKELPDAKRASLRLILGHMIFGFHEFLSQPYTYVTVLRDPVDRIVSYYYYILSYPGHYLHNTVRSQKMSLMDLVSSGISKEFDNLQTRRLSANDKVGFGQCSPEMIEQAEQNLQEYFGVVGIMERFDETLLLMKSTFAWKSCYYEKINVTKNRPKKHDVPKDVLDVISEYNKLDIELYKRTKTMFENQVGQLDKNFHRDLERFRSLNKFYQRFHPLIRKSKRISSRLNLN